MRLAFRKYRNKPSGGFASQKERRVSERLELWRNAMDPHERIVRIDRQVRYELIPAQRDPGGKLLERACHYVADFVVEYADGRVAIIDAKGFRTRDYVMKRKLMLFRRGIRIEEV